MAEKEILDFFLTNKLNGQTVTIEYEPDVHTFRPDFCLKDYDLFIEHWALDETGKVPSWFNQTTEEYRLHMQEKRAYFTENNKLLVETFAYEFNKSNPSEFTELLKKRVIDKLQEQHKQAFEFTPMSYEEIVRTVWGPYKNPIDDIVNFITNAKTYALTPQRITEKLHDGKWSSKQLAFGELVTIIYRMYEEYLRNNNKIDFEDMINNAIQELSSDNILYANAYEHILIDEYQDISAQRHKLIKKLLERNPNCRLFCVGDDWQSIMGFSGSNLTFFVNFGQYFENPAITKLSTNYRSIKSIVDAGTDLIKKNGQSQMPKETRANRQETKPIRVFRSPHKEEYEKRYYRQTAEHCLNRITEYLQKGYAPKDILVLTRYMRTRTKGAYKFVPVIKIFVERAQEKNIGIAHERTYAENQIRLLTAHRSKGLEAKVVFVLNMTKGVYGFPCEIEDQSIYSPARENYPKQDQKQEERRLFYVAMTRAKEDLIIYTQEHAKSEFLNEIKQYVVEERLSY
jgi:DNA helicase-4